MLRNGLGHFLLSQFALFTILIKGVIQRLSEFLQPPLIENMAEFRKPGIIHPIDFSMKDRFETLFVSRTLLNWFNHSKTIVDCPRPRNRTLDDREQREFGLTIVFPCGEIGPGSQAITTKHFF